jgi:hypothetical protein
MDERMHNPPIVESARIMDLGDSMIQGLAIQGFGIRDSGSVISDE